MPDITISGDFLEATVPSGSANGQCRTLPGGRLVGLVQAALAFHGEAFPGFGHFQKLSSFLGRPGALRHAAALVRMFAILVGFLHRVPWQHNL